MKSAIALCKLSVKQGVPVELSMEQIHALSQDDRKKIEAEFGSSLLMKLPKEERDFFDWVKEHDPAAWNDLWGADPESEYLVSLSFLQRLVDSSRGFPICDLESCDNYYFAPSHFNEVGIDFLLPVKERFKQRLALTTSQLLALEISLGAIDIWHFAYFHGIELTKAKECVQHLVDDGVLRHVTKYEELADDLEL